MAMPLAILLVLILIAVILAPWLLGVIAVLVAAYGVWLVLGIAVTAAFFIVGMVIYAIKMGISPSHKIPSSVELKIAEANRSYREKESSRREAALQENLKLKEITERAKKSRMTICKNCGASIQKHGIYCPECGKPPI